MTGASDLAITLDNLGSAEIETFAAGFENFATGNYTVASAATNNATANLEATAITLNGADIKDVYGNSLASDVLPTDNFSENDIVIDVTPPSLETITAKVEGVTASEDQNAPTWAKLGDEIVFTLNFDDKTRLYGTLTINLNTETDTPPVRDAYGDDLEGLQNPTVTYIVQDGDKTPVGDNSRLEIEQIALSNKLTDNPSITWDDNGTRFPNAVENTLTPVTAFPNAEWIKVDGIPPTILSATTTAYTDNLGTALDHVTNGYYGIGARSTVQQTFSDPVTLSDAVMPLDLNLKTNMSFSLDAVLGETLSQYFDVQLNGNDGTINNILSDF